VLLGGGVAAAYLVVHARVGDVHNGASEPFFFTSGNSSTETTPPSTGNGPPKPDFGPPWTMYGRNAEHNRDASELRGIHPPFRVLWKHKQWGLTEYPPSYVNGVLYQTTDVGWMHAFRAGTGKILWVRRYNKVLQQPAYDRGRIYVGAYDRNIYCLDAKTGREIWKRGIGEDIESPITVVGDRLYFGGLSGTVRAIDARTGRTYWRYNTSGAVKGSVAVSQGRVFAADYSGTMYSLRASDGKLLWRTHTAGLSGGFRSGTFYSTPNVRYGRVYIGNTDGKLYSFVASSGKIAWTHTFGSWVYSSPAVSDGVVFASAYDGDFAALDARTGDVKWSTNLGYKSTSSPTVIGRLVYVASHGFNNHQGHLWAFDPRNGRKVFHFPAGWYSTVVAAGKNRLVVAGPRTLYVLQSR
jgi:outer membrane protein assembly factor BamB